MLELNSTQLALVSSQLGAGSAEVISGFFLDPDDDTMSPAKVPPGMVISSRGLRGGQVPRWPVQLGTR
jgi:hypothetical protein